MNNLFHLKDCPKCGGDVVVDEDAYGAYERCVQCGADPLRSVASYVQEEIDLRCPNCGHVAKGERSLRAHKAQLH